MLKFEKPCSSRPGSVVVATNIPLFSLLKSGYPCDLLWPIGCEWKGTHFHSRAISGHELSSSSMGFILPPLATVTSAVPASSGSISLGPGVRSVTIQSTEYFISSIAVP